MQSSLSLSISSSSTAFPRSDRNIVADDNIGSGSAVPRSLKFCGLRREVFGCHSSSSARRIAAPSRRLCSKKVFAALSSNGASSKGFDYDLVIIGAGVGGHGAALHAVEKIMIPQVYLTKMGLYDVRVNGVSVKVRVADNPSVVDLGLTELRSQMRTPPNVLGLAVKESSKLGKAALLQLCAGNHCLVIQLHLMASIPQSLKTFLADVNLTFVGAFMVTSISKLKNPYVLDVVNGIEVAELAAKILKNHSLIGISDSNLSIRPASLSTVASAVGLPFEYPKNVASVEPALPVFTQEEIDYLVRDVYALHLVGKKLLESL